MIAGHMKGQAALDADLLDFAGMGGYALESCDPPMILDEVEESLRGRAGGVFVVVAVVVIRMCGVVVGVVGLVDGLDILGS